MKELKEYTDEELVNELASRKLDLESINLKTYSAASSFGRNVTLDDVLIQYCIEGQDNIALPEGLKLRPVQNQIRDHDMFFGPCECGATHSIECWSPEDVDKVIEEINKSVKNFYDKIDVSYLISFRVDGKEESLYYGAHGVSRGNIREWGLVPEFFNEECEDTYSSEYCVAETVERLKKLGYKHIEPYNCDW